MGDFPLPNPSPQGGGALRGAILPNSAFAWSTALLVCFGDRHKVVPPPCGEGLGRGLYWEAIPCP
jgi:hypothetical protein